jgi:cytochrome c551/c552
MRHLAKRYELDSTSAIQPRMKQRFILFFVASSIGNIFLHANESADFVEKEQPFLRSALVISEKSVNIVRRGVLIRLGEDLWTCFDPDLLRYAAIWKSPPNQPPLTLDSMAAVSYPDKQAKADKPPFLSGTILASTPELPGVGFRDIPFACYREGLLTDGKTKVGPLPVENFRWQGISLRDKQVILNYRIGTRQIKESTHAIKPDLIERVISISPGENSIAINLDAYDGTIITSGISKFVTLTHGELPYLLVSGIGVSVFPNPGRGIFLVLEPSRETITLQILRSSAPITNPPAATPISETASATPLFPQKIESASPAPPKTSSPIATRSIKLLFPNPWKRAIRPTDIAFLSNGDALLTTLDGDVWRITNIDKPNATWSRAAFGIFEPMSITVSAKDEAFVLGRDQITKLEDTNGDGFFDNYLCASDAFRQTIHTRDYATSLELLPDGSFVIGRAGLLDDKPHLYNENTTDRGSILKISPDGITVTTLADGLRVPYIGLRADGAIFSSDQQGNYIPSSPVHLIDGGTPYLGYEPSDFRKKKQPISPLLWFPYQINRSGAAFATLPARSFPSLGDRFAHLSWSGRIFITETPSVGQPFGWKLPAEFDFPILGAATQPTTGKFFATGIGISGYKPTTSQEIGLAEISENYRIVTPVSVDVRDDRITVAFREPLPPGLSLITPRPQLDLWNIQRSKKYGSGHFRWDGKPGEHAVTIGELDISADRKSISFAVPTIFRSDILRLKLYVTDTVSGSTPYEIELYTRPAHLPMPTAANFADVAKREKTAVVTMVPGNPERGSVLFKNYGCIGCHALDGTKLTGPPLNGIAARHSHNLDAFLKTSILNPTAVITPGYEASMPAFAGVIPDQDIEHLVAYLKKM